MCSRCRTVVASMLTAILAAAPENIRERYAESGMTGDRLKSLDDSIDGLKLLHRISDTYMDPTLTPEECKSSLEALLAGDRENRATVGELVCAAKFAHYASVLLSGLAFNLKNAIDVRAAEDYDHTAIDFAFEDVAAEIAAYARAHEPLRERDEPEMPPIAVLVAMANKAGIQMPGMPGKPKPPKYEN